MHHLSTSSFLLSSILFLPSLLSHLTPLSFVRSSPSSSPLSSFSSPSFSAHSFRHPLSLILTRLNQQVGVDCGNSTEENSARLDPWALDLTTSAAVFYKEDRSRNHPSPPALRDELSQDETENEYSIGLQIGKYLGWYFCYSTRPLV